MPFSGIKGAGKRHKTIIKKITATKIIERKITVTKITKYKIISKKIIRKKTIKAKAKRFLKDGKIISEQFYY